MAINAMAAPATSRQSREGALIRRNGRKLREESVAGASLHLNGELEGGEVKGARRNRRRRRG
jgi:hypothetical protein